MEEAESDEDDDELLVSLGAQLLSLEPLCNTGMWKNSEVDSLTTAGEGLGSSSFSMISELTQGERVGSADYIL